MNRGPSTGKDKEMVKRVWCSLVVLISMDSPGQRAVEMKRAVVVEVLGCTGELTREDRCVKEEEIVTRGGRRSTDGIRRSKGRCCCDGCCLQSSESAARLAGVGKNSKGSDAAGWRLSLVSEARWLDRWLDRTSDPRSWAQVRLLRVGWCDGSEHRWLGGRGSISHQCDDRTRGVDGIE
jgi:hypothetical protein